MWHTDVFHIVERRGAEANDYFSRKTSKEPKPIFRQTAVYAALRPSEALDCTRRTVLIAERQAEDADTAIS